MASKRSAFGEVEKLKSGRYRARYPAPDGRRHSAPMTFETKTDANKWLAVKQSEIIKNEWRPPASKVSFGEYATTWLELRTLKPRTRYGYQRLLETRILPTFKSTPLRSITAKAVGEWYLKQGAEHPTARAHAYSLLRTIMADALREQLINFNPVSIYGAGNSKSKIEITPATLDELATICEHMPKRLKLMVLLAAWCAMRFGELAELRRSDIDMANGIVKVRRAVTWVDGQSIIGEPKSSAGVRDIHIPPHLLPVVRDHLHGNITGGKDGLLFPSANDPTRHMFSASLYKTFRRARRIAERPDLRFHDLRHTGAVMAAQSGATLAELMNRLGHSTAGAAMRYQHASAERDKAIAEKLSLLSGLEATKEDTHGA